MKTNKHMTNLQLAKLFRAVAAALELIPGDNRFRVIAYDKAADTIENATSETESLWQEGQLKNMPGIGPNIASHLQELFTTGRVLHFIQLLKPFPPALFELLDIPGIGPKTAKQLCEDLGITKAHTAVSKLQKAAQNGHIAKLPGFGEDSQAQILKSIQEYTGREKRLLLPAAESIADQLVEWLLKDQSVIRADPLGSLRRQSATVGDIDIAVASDQPGQVIAHFCLYPKKIRVLESGPHTASLILPNDYQVDLMVQPPSSYGSLLQHFTGSKFHNIALRELALKKGYSLSEYGIKPLNSNKHFHSPEIRRGDKGVRFNKEKDIFKFSSETDFYNFLCLDFIPPELREDTGEILAAQNHTLPQLIQLSDIKGDLHVHSGFDTEPSHDLGENSPAEMLDAAGQLGYEYLGLTEHNPGLAGHSVAQILDILKRKQQIIEELNSSHSGTFLFNGLEIDIQTTGQRTLPDQAFEFLDYAAVSVHSSFRLSKTAQTRRVLEGLSHPKALFLGHPTGRLLEQRQGIDLDWDKIFAFCLANNKWLEINSWPNRLDLPDSLVRQAIQNGVKVIINSDSHATHHLPYLKYGVKVARRGWAKKSDIVNTVPLSGMQKLIKGR